MAISVKEELLLFRLDEFGENAKDADDVVASEIPQRYSRICL